MTSGEGDAMEAGMTDETMVERVARAIYVVEYPEANSQPHLDCVFGIGSDARGEDADTRWLCDRYRMMARAAIEAMREPTPEMLSAADKAHTDSGCMFYEGAETGDLWNAMLTAALK